MWNNSRRSQQGFTLVEMAIVLAVAGTLFLGLWRLLSTGNQQLKDSSAASQQSQLISATKNFLSSATGQTFLGGLCTTGTGCAAGSTYALPLPSAAAVAGSGTCATTGFTGAMIAGTPTPASTWCSTLPSGFSQGTTNSYGQSYSIRVKYESATTASNVPPTTYSFMILTQGGDVAADSSGGRISAQIGGDGGFVYTTPPATPCAAGLACGAYGSWALNPTGYGFTAASIVAGHAASRTYISPEQEAYLPWLARQAVPGGASYNSMQTNFYLNASGTGIGNTLYGTGTAATSTTSFGGAIIGVQEVILGMNSGDTVPALAINDYSVLVGGNPCAANTITGGQPYDNATACNWSMQINGNQSTTGLVQAGVLWANQFIYGTISDLRLKSKIAPLGDDLSKLMQLKPVSFRYKGELNARDNAGFIAQDLEKIYPEMVMNRGDGMLGVDYIQMIGHLVRSVQQLKQDNDELHQENDELRHAVEALQKSNNP